MVHQYRYVYLHIYIHDIHIHTHIYTCAHTYIYIIHILQIKHTHKKLKHINAECIIHTCIHYLHNTYAST